MIFSWYAELVTDPSKPSCPHVAECPMFGMFTLSGTLRIWQDNYCHSDFERCERFARSQRGESVPKSLMPNGKLLAVPSRNAG